MSGCCPSIITDKAKTHSWCIVDLTHWLQIIRHEPVSESVGGLVRYVQGISFMSSVEDQGSEENNTWEQFTDFFFVPTITLKTGLGTILSKSYPSDDSHRNDNN